MTAAPSAPDRRFAYHRRLGPPVAVLLGLAVVEAGVVHLAVVAWLGRPAAWAFAAVDGALVATLASLLRSFRTRPVLLSDDRLLLRTGWRLAVAVPLADVEGLADGWDAADLKAPDALNLALVAWPTVAVTLKRPVRHRGRPRRLLAHGLDDPAGFRADLGRRLAAQAGSGAAPR